MHRYVDYTLTVVSYTHHTALVKAVDRAMSALRGMKTGMRGEIMLAQKTVGQKRRLISQLASKLLTKKIKKCGWKHRFFCLSMKDEARLPTTEIQKDDL